MLELIICWLIGHKPTENEIELRLENLPGCAITLCERCNNLITYDVYRGWIKW